jgi:hypothetical protein
LAAKGSIESPASVPYSQVTIVGNQFMACQERLRMNHFSSIRFRSGRFSAAALLLWTAAFCATGVQSEDRSPQEKTPEKAQDKSKSGSEGKPARSQGPEYTGDGQLKLPVGFESWVFVGANLGIEYREDNSKDPPAAKNSDDKLKGANFHNVYIDPDAFEHFVKTGKFPDKTMLVLDIYKAEAGEPRNIVSQGLFPGKQKEIAVAVKNSARPDGSKTDWAYYDFPLGQKTAKAFPDKACYDCHLQHADRDNVWVQFYPILKARQPKQPD